MHHTGNVSMHLSSRSILPVQKVFIPKKDLCGGLDVLIDWTSLGGEKTTTLIIFPIYYIKSYVFKGNLKF